MYTLSIAHGVFVLFGAFAVVSQPLTKPVAFTPGDATRALNVILTQGWWEPEADACWTGRDGQSGAFEFTPEPGWAYDVRISLNSAPLNVAPETVKALVNGAESASLSAEVKTTLSFRIAAASLPPGQPVKVDIVAPFFRPSDDGQSPDTRALGVKVTQIRIVPRMPGGEGGVRKVALFYDPAAPVSGAPSDPERLAGILNAAGVTSTIIGPDELGDSARFHTGAYDIVILPNAPAFPFPARESFLDFLQSGGSFISMGGYVFNDVYGAAGADGGLLVGGGFDANAEGWAPGAPLPDGVSFTCVDGALLAEATVNAPVNWHDLGREITLPEPGKTVRIAARIKTDNLRDGFGAYAALSCFNASGERLACPQTEIIKGTANWTLATGSGEIPPGTAKARLGLIIHGRGKAWFDDAAVTIYAPPMNTATGKGADFLETDPVQIGAFDAGYPLRGAMSATAHANQFIIPQDTRIEGAIKGWAAIGTLGENWYCTVPDRARWSALMETADAFGRPTGPLAGMTINYSGMYERSIWAYFGAENMDLFAADHPGMDNALTELVAAIRRKTFLHGSRSPYACYRDGEKVDLSVKVSNWGDVDRELAVRFEAIDEETGESAFMVEKPAQVSTGDTMDLAAEWTPGVFNGDLYRVQTTLLENGQPIDRENSNGFVVWKKETFQGLPKLALKDNVMRLGDRPIFMLGGQQFWSSLSIRNSSPLVVAEDFRNMRDMGVRINRSFMMWALRPEEEETRFRDMMVYLAHKYGVVMFYEGIADCPSATDDYEKELARARFVAKRYGDLPLFCVDLRNEPAVRVTPGERQQGWLDAWTKVKYNGAPPYGKPEVRPMSLEWGDLASADMSGCLLNYLSGWTRIQADMLHKTKPGLLVSVGYLQNISGPGVIEYPKRASDGLDFMNRHFYGALENFPPQLKETDMRVLGKPTSVGEFGSKTHPGKGGNYESPESQFNRYLFITHYTFGLGGAFASNWHWRDPWENIFPYGLMHQDNVAKPIAKAYRDMALLFASVRPKDEAPEVYVVLPEAHRAAYFPLAQSIYAGFNELMNQRVEYGVIPESNLDKLPAEAKALFYPMPFLSDEKTVSTLEGFIQRGGVLYLSGDIGYDDRFVRSHPEWLARLTGVGDVKTLTTGLKLPLPESQPAQGKAEGAANYNAASILQFGAGDDAVVLHATAGGQPISIEHALGKGKVVYTADPVEARPKDLAASGLYGYVLKRAGVGVNKITPDAPDLHCFRRSTEDGEAYVIYDRREAPIVDGDNTIIAPFKAADTREVTLTGMDITLTTAPMKPGFTHITTDGRLLAVQTQGPVTRGGVRLLDTDTHVIVLALDGQDIAISRMLAVMTFYPGSVRLKWNGGVTKMETMFIDHGQWRSLNVMDTPTKDGAISWTIKPEASLEINLVAVDMDAAKTKLLELAGFPVK